MNLLHKTNLIYHYYCLSNQIEVNNMKKVEIKIKSVGNKYVTIYRLVSDPESGKLFVI